MRNVHENHGRILGSLDDSDDEDKVDQTDEVIEDEELEEIDGKSKAEQNAESNLKSCIDLTLLKLPHDVFISSRVIVRIDNIKHPFSGIVSELAQYCKGFTESSIEEILQKEFKIPEISNEKFSYYKLYSAPEMLPAERLPNMSSYDLTVRMPNNRSATSRRYVTG